MSLIHRIEIGFPALLEFRGPDAARYLNGQITQDVRLVADGKRTLPSCVTDAKGRLQFRVWISASDAAFVVEGPAEDRDPLEARLTRYLIADDVECSDLTGIWRIVHFTGPLEDAPPGVIARGSARFGSTGVDWWIPAGLEVGFPGGIAALEGESLEAFRIARGIPAWGAELAEGMLPPEAGLDATDISYQKGCYIGQEVISRIRSAGKVNRRLVRLGIDASVAVQGLELVDPSGASAGVLTSVSPLPEGATRPLLGYVKRGASSIRLRSADGVLHETSPA